MGCATESQVRSDSPLEEAGFELLVPSINPARPVLTPDAMSGHIGHVCFRRAPRVNRRATVLSLQGSHTLSGKAGQLQA
jgi:hypothetical protein